MEYRTLGNTGLQVSVLSFGASSLGSMFRDIDEYEGIRTVHEAIDSGINLIDVSPFYGLTKAESVLGRAIQHIPRDQFILSTKAGRYGDNDFDFSYKRIKSSVVESLNRLNTDYLDILHLHDIEFGTLNQIIEESIPALQELKKEGIIRYYGISGLPLKVFKEVSNQVHVDTILSYCQYSLNNTSLLNMANQLKEKEIGIINASPLSMGLLSKRGAPDWHPASPYIKERCREAVKYCEDNGEDISKLALQFSTANRAIPTTLVGTANPDNLKKNINWIQEPIDQQLLKEVRTILRPIENNIWTSGKQENN